jgi:hypothetical protein
VGILPGQLSVQTAQVQFGSNSRDTLMQKTKSKGIKPPDSSRIISRQLERRGHTSSWKIVQRAGLFGVIVGLAIIAPFMGSGLM